MRHDNLVCQYLCYAPNAWLKRCLDTFLLGLRWWLNSFQGQVLARQNSPAESGALVAGEAWALASHGSLSRSCGSGVVNSFGGGTTSFGAVRSCSLTAWPLSTGMVIVVPGSAGRPPSMVMV